MRNTPLSRLMLLLPLLLVASHAFAMPTPQEMLQGIDQSLQNGVVQLISAACTVLGLSLLFSGVYKLKVYGEARTMMASQANLKEPLTMLFVASIFLFLPSFIGTFLLTVYKNPQLSPLSIITSEVPQWQIGIHAILDIIKVVGFISFIRGWLFMVQATQQGRGGFGKGLMHIVGGILALNVSATWEVLRATTHWT